MNLIVSILLIVHVFISIVNIVLYRNVICIKYKYIPTMMELLCCVCPIINLGYFLHLIKTIADNQDLDKLARKILFIKGE